MTRKKRISPSDDLSAEVLWASDRACCICHKRRRSLQIHHIDGNPSNTTLDNLAVLCLECHVQTQISGGFARKYSPALVTKYRDEWLATVKQKRAAEASGVKAPAPRRTQPRMSQEQARQHAQRLRTLYAKFFQGVGYMRDVAFQMSAPLLNETWDQREARLNDIYNQARQMIGSTLPEIQIEPGSAQVCQHFESFRAQFGQVMASAVHNHDHPGFFSKLNMGFTMGGLDEKVDDIRTAIQNHLAQVDKRS